MQERDTEMSRGSTTAGAGPAHGGDLSETAREEGQKLGRRAREEAQRLQQEASERGTRMLEERKGWLTGEVDAIAQALHASADELDSGDPNAAHYAHMAADALDRVSDHLHRHDVRDLMRSSQEFARREPALLIGGAIAAGFVLSRFLKSSESHTAPSEHGYR